MAAAPSGVVLIVTHGEDDDHADRVITALLERGATPVRFDTERYPEQSRVELTTMSGRVEVEFRLGGRLLHGREVYSVLYRHRRLPVAPEVVAEPAARRMAESELLALLDGALMSLDAFWVNHPAANRLARHKALQLTLARAEGFELPPTCITADPAVVRRLWHEWDGQMIAKLVGGQVPDAPGEEPYAVFTTQLASADLSDDAAIAAAPAIYQRLLDKTDDVRVTVVGDEVFACRIPSRQSENGRVDWRLAGRGVLAHAPMTLDGVTAGRCRSLTHRLGLELACIDLALMPDGRPVFFEINASGRWAWVEDATGMPIAAAIAGLLLDGGPRRRPSGGKPVAADGVRG